jgi:hypothetical protein
MYTKVPDFYQCTTPTEMYGKKLLEFNPTESECFPVNQYVIVGTVLGSLMLLLVITSTAMYRYRWNIKYYVYMMRKRREYQQIQLNDVIVYDAFVAYNRADAGWVANDLQPFLETQNDFKLCLHDRDFDLGVSIVDKMAQSRKIILVLSNNFARSQWCQFEMLMAQRRDIEDRNILVLIILEDIRGRHVTPALRVLLTTVTSLTWTQDEHGQQLFWGKLTDTMKRAQ